MKYRYLYFLLAISVVTLLACDRETERRKIRLSDQIRETRTDDQITTTIQLEPKERRSIAVMFFQNLTGDKNLQWLQKGLTEMLIRALSQSRSLSVLSTDRLYEILKRLDQSTSAEKIDMDMAAIVAREANVEAILVGNITRSGNDLKINVKLKEPSQGMTLKEESVEGSGLETIFSMVDQLTQKIKQDLHLSLDRAEPLKGIEEISTNSLEAWRYYTDGNELMNKVLWGEANELFEQALALDSTFVSARLNLAVGLLAQRRITEAVKQFEKLNQVKEKATPRERYKIDFFEANINYDVQKAIDICNEWLKDYPEDRDAHMHIASFYFGLHNYEKAIYHYEKILEIDPKYKLTYNQLGYSYAFTCRFDEAVSILKKYIEIAPDEPNPYDSLGEIYLLMGEYKLAEQSFQQALKINDNFYASINQLANIYIDKGDFKQALKFHTAYLEKVPQGNLKANAYSSLAATFWKLRKLDLATENYQKALEYADYSYPIIENMHGIFIENGDSTNAKKVLLDQYAQTKNKLQSDYTEFAPILDLIQFSLFHQINRDETIDLIKKSLDKLKNQPLAMQVKFFLSLLYTRADRTDEIDQLREGSSRTQFATVFSEIRNFSYTTIWKYYFILNESFTQSLEAGINYYQGFVDLFKEKDAQLTEMVFRRFLADLYSQNNQPEQAAEQLRIIGMPEESKWMVLAPFDNKGGFHKKFKPEKKIKLDKFYRTKSGKAKWQTAHDGNNDGFINLRDIYADSRWSVGYGLIYVKSPDDRHVQIRVGSDASVKIWLNDEEIWKLNEHRNAIFDDDIIRVSLKKGLNKVLIKVCNRLGDWGFYFRVTDEEGNGIGDIEFVTPFLESKTNRLEQN